MVFRVLAVLLVLAGLAWQFWRVLGQTDGTLFYTLDDPYIHLSLAENILRGHYGINGSEAASPSSSILYPFVLAGGLALGLGDYAPFVFNALPMLGAAWILGGIVSRLRPSVEPFVIIALAFLLLAVNAVSLPFTGMEHSIQIWASLLIVAGLFRLVETGRADLWLVLGIVLAPLMRFECFALSGCAILALLFWGRFGAAVLSAALLAAITAAYILFMDSLGLPFLPSSVLVKSDVSAAAVDETVADAIASMLVAFWFAAQRFFGVVVLIGLGLILMSFGQRDTGKARLTIGLTVIAVGLAHMTFAEFSGFPRYEGYLIAVLYAALLWLFTPLLHQAGRIVGVGLALSFAALSQLYLVPFGLTPEAAQNIRDQQWQMHRFVTDFFPERVAVNDLGWVSYQNEEYVLDLWGLGSEEARRIAGEGRTPEAVDELAARHDVVFAMVYEAWLGDAIPASWCRIAQLETIEVTASEPYVEFYLIDPSREAEMRAALAAFEAELLPETSLLIFDCAG